MEAVNISVLGCGRWGSFIAWYLNRIGHRVCLYGRESSEKFRRLRETGTNGMVTFGSDFCYVSNLEQAVARAGIVVISVGSQSLRGLMRQLSPGSLAGKTVVLCMKGVEIETGKRLTEVVEEFVGPETTVAIWVGPGHVQEFVKGVPNCMVIDSRDREEVARLVRLFSSELIRFYFGTDLIGNEIGAAAKNVIGIAAGMLDGLGRSSLKGALMSRGTREVARLIQAMGGNELSAYGLCHLGDYEATVFSHHSHNRMCGEMLARGEKFPELAEGVYTVKALLQLADRHRVEMPICRAVYAVLYQQKDPNEALSDLFLRSIKAEF